jgi:hypothetical protein
MDKIVKEHQQSTTLKFVVYPGNNPQIIKNNFQINKAWEEVTT